MDENTYALIKKFGVKRLADELECSSALVSRWRYRRIPAERAKAVSEKTGIPLHRLRPDIWEPRQEQAA